MIWLLLFYHNENKTYPPSAYSVPETVLSVSKLHLILFLNQPYKMGTTIIIHFMD